MGHGLKLHTFCSIAWPGKAIWNRDIDKSADAEVVQTLSLRTGTSLERAHATTLAAYEGILYDKHNRFGPNPWIMPVGVYHRTRRQFGLQYCPTCLAEDIEPYFRRKWRLGFLVVCEKHGTQVYDRCSQCGMAVNFHRDELGNFRKFAPVSMTLCFACGSDLREATNKVSHSRAVTPMEVGFTAELLLAMDKGVATVCETSATYSHLYFTVLRQLMKIVGMRDKRVGKLRQAVSITYGVEDYIPGRGERRRDVEEEGVQQRRQLLGLARCLLEEWPHRFIALAQAHKVWSSTWLRHLESGSRRRSQPAPFWFWEVVHEHLYRTRYCPSPEETAAAISYLRRSGAILNKSSLARLLGVAFFRRKSLL